MADKPLDPIAAKREKRNIGPVLTIPGTDGPVTESITMVERFLLRLLRVTIDYLKDNPAETKRLFRHLFDATVNDEEIDQLIIEFNKNTPKVQQGYAREAAEFPLYAIVMLNEEEQDTPIGQYMGIDEDEHEEFIGSTFKSTFGIFCYSNNADYTGYLWHLAKAIVLGGIKLLLSNGVNEVSMSGGDLTPEDARMPPNLYVRVLNVITVQPTHVPRILTSFTTQLLGLHLSHLRIDGVLGGIKPYVPEESSG